MEFLEYFNPLKHVSPGQYVSFWHYVLANLFTGFWARLIASISICFSFWFGVYRRRLGLGLVFFIITVIISYFGSLAKVAFWWF